MNVTTATFIAMRLCIFLNEVYFKLKRKLLELGCDPSLSDTLGRVPYILASDKETRSTFRRFMGTNPNRYDYAKAQIPSPLTEDIEKKKLEKLAEKRKQQRQAKKERQALEKARLEQEKLKIEEQKKLDEEQRKIQEEKQRFLQLSDREKVRIISTSTIHVY